MTIHFHLLPLALCLFAFVQGPVTGRLDGAVMDENVLTAVTLDEPIAFIVVEPFHSAYFGHLFLRPTARGLTRASLIGAMFGPFTYQIKARLTPIRLKPSDS